MAYRYVDNIGEIITSKINIVDVVNDSVMLVKKGRNYKACCPFHSEKTPSFVVSEDKGIFKCFGCGESGNAISFVMKYYKLDFINAIEYIADKYSIDLSAYRSTNNNYKKLDDYYELNKKVARDYFEHFNNNTKARDYMTNRGIRLKTLRKFGIGYSHDKWDYVYKKYLKILNQEMIEHSGLFIKNKSGSYYDRFRNRIMFPIFDIRNRVIGFGARALNNDDMPKYLNSPDTYVYNKSYHLYGLNYAKNTKNHYFILVEGYMDVIGLYDKGIDFAVASLGTSLTKEQAKLLKRYHKDLYIVYDGDEAGIKATNRAIDILKEYDINTYALVLPDSMDPDEYVIENGVDNFLDYIEKNKLEAYGFLLNNLKNKFDLSKSNERYSYLKEASELIHSFGKKIDKVFYMKQLASELNISEETLLVDISQIESRDKLLDESKVKNEIEVDESTYKFMAMVLHEKEIAFKIIKSDYFQYLSNQTRKLITLVVSDGGYKRDKAIDILSIEYIDFVEKSLNSKYDKNDMDNWEVLYKYIVDIRLRYKISKLRKKMLSMKEDSVSILKEIETLQMVRSHLKKKG